MSRIVTWDIEIAKTIEEAGGWGAAKRGEAGMSCAVTHLSSSDDEPDEPQIRVWDEATIDEMAQYLEAADAIVTFNGKGFDIPAVSGLLGREVRPRKHYDILAEIWNQIGTTFAKGWGLDAIAKRTLGRGKTGSGAHAPELWQQGYIASVVNYCMDDVLLTRDLFDYIQEEGHVVAPEGYLTLPRLEDIQDA